MPRILLTAYGPYDQWSENASWHALRELMLDTPSGLEITTRLYPVDFVKLLPRLESDLQEGFDVVLHLGQAPGSGRIELETVGINLGMERGSGPGEAFPLAPDGPAAYQSTLPLGDWAALLQSEGIPAAVSFHAGTYLCNAALYLTHYLSERDGLVGTEGQRTAATFLHLPLDTPQAVKSVEDTPSLPAVESARAIRLILEDARHRLTVGEARATGSEIA